MAAVLAMVGVGFTFASPVLAGPAPTLTVTGTSVSGVDPGSTTTLSGVALSGDAGDTLQVSVTTDSGSLEMTEIDNLTLGPGYSWSGTTISFSGTEADDNAGLASLELVAGSAGTAHISVSAFVAEAGLSYSPSNDHFYQYFADSGVSWSDAETAAATQSYGGVAGYLATIPDATVNTFVADNTGATDVWFGAHVDTTDTSYPRVWKWTDGSLVGGVISNCDAISGPCSFNGGTDGLGGDLYSSWASGEPNNFGYDPSVPGSGEDSGVTNWDGSAGLWNDLSNTSSDISGYLVEYGNQVVGSDPAPTDTASASSSVDVFAAPSAPTAATAITTGRTATVTWTASDNDGGTPVTAYTVTASPGGATCSATAPATHCTVQALTGGEAYTFTVTATNSSGISAPSAPSSLVTVLSLPPVVGVTHPSEGGYVMVTAAGNVYAHDASFYGSPFDRAIALEFGLDSPVVGIAAEQNGGYIVATARGSVYAFKAAWDGSPYAAGVKLGSPVVGIAAGRNGLGYVLVTADGTVYNYGTSSEGSPAASGTSLASPIVAISSKETGGYVMVTRAGTVYAYGTAYHGSRRASAGVSPVVGIAEEPDGGYVIATARGNVHAFGTLWDGSPAASGLSLTAPIVAITTADGHGYHLVTSVSTDYAYAK